MARKKKPLKRLPRFTPKDVDTLERYAEAPFRSIVEGRLRHNKALREEVHASLRRSFPFAGNDHSVQAECDDRHMFLLPLRTDRPLGAVEKALDVFLCETFPDRLAGGLPGSGNVFKRNILEYIRLEREKREEREKAFREWIEERGIMRNLLSFFFSHLSRETLQKVLSVDGEVRPKIPMTPGLAAKVSRRLFLKFYDLRFQEDALRKRFQRMLSTM